MQIETRSLVAQIDRFFTRDVPHFLRAMDELSREIDANALAQKDRHWSRMQQAFQASQDACRNLECEISDQPDVISEVRDRFQKETDYWIRQSWFGDRARTKPSGFPGDYAMLLMLYNQKPMRTGVGGYLDLCLSELALARAVKARRIAAHDYLVRELQRRRGVVRILNVASGPCHEYLNWTDPLAASRIELVCLDNDPAAIQYVMEEVVPTATGIADFRLVRHNALRTKSAQSTIRQFGQFDIVYSIGLCDYIPDEPLIAMLQGWRETLREDGVVYVAFKDCRQYDKTPYQWHLDWHFLQRTEEDCWELFRKAGYDLDDMEVTRDETGIIVNFITGARARSRRRFDGGVRDRIGHAPHASLQSSEVS